MQTHSIFGKVSRSTVMVAVMAGTTALAAGGCVDSGLDLDGEQDGAGDQLELDSQEAAITGGTVDLMADGSVSGTIASCTSQNLGPGTIQSTDGWATGVALKNKWGSTIYYAWISHNVSLPPGGSAGFAFDANGAYWRSPQDTSFYGAIGSFSGYTVDCIANAGVYFQSNATETYVTPASIPESSYSNNVKRVKSSTK